MFCPHLKKNKQSDGFNKIIHPSAKDCKDYPVTEQVIEICHGYQACSFAADPYKLRAPPCHHLQSVMKTTFACVDKSAFNAEFVDRQTTPKVPSTTTTRTPPTTSNVITYKAQNTSKTHETATSYWQEKVDTENIEAEPLEPKPSQDHDEDLYGAIGDQSIFQVTKRDHENKMHH